MKRTIGYKVGSMVQIASESSPNGLRTLASTELRPFPGQKNDDWKANDPEKSPKISTITKKLAKEVPPQPKDSVEAVQQEKIELIRNMIREEISKEKKYFVKIEFKDVVLEQIQQLNLQLTKLKNIMVDTKSDKGLPLSKIDEVKILLLKEIKNTSDKNSESIERGIKDFQSKFQTKFKNRQSGLQTRLDSLSTKMNKGIADLTDRFDKQLKLNSLKNLSAFQSTLEDSKSQGKKTHAASRIAALQSSVSSILLKLQSPKPTLCQPKQPSAGHSSKITDTLSKLTEENKQRRKETSELHKEIVGLNKMIGAFGERVELQEGELAERMSKFEKRVSLKEVNEAIEEINEQLVGQGRSIERVNHEVHKTRECLDDFQVKIEKLQGRIARMEPENGSNILCRDEFDDLFQSLSKSLQSRLSCLITQYNCNFQTLQQNFTQIRDITIQVIDLNKSLTQRLHLLFSKHSQGHLKLTQFQKLSEQTLSSLSTTSQKLLEILRRDLCFEHEIKLLRDRVDQLECLNTRRRLASTDSANSDKVANQAKENKQPEERRRGNQRGSVSLQEEKVYDQFGIFD